MLSRSGGTHRLHDAYDVFRAQRDGRSVLDVTGLAILTSLDRFFFLLWGVKSSRRGRDNTRKRRGVHNVGAYLPRKLSSRGETCIANAAVAEGLRGTQNQKGCKKGLVQARNQQS